MSKMKTLIAVLAAMAIGTTVASATNWPDYDLTGNIINHENRSDDVSVGEWNIEPGFNVDAVDTDNAIPGHVYTPVENPIDTTTPVVFESNVYSDLVWRVAGYDTSTIYQQDYNKIMVVYQAFDPLTGLPSGPVVSGDEAAMYGLPVLTQIKLVRGVELDYPNNEYFDVYALSPATNTFEDTGKNVYAGINRNVPYREINLYWEACPPYRVIKVTQANFDGSRTTWFSNDTYPLVFRDDFAVVRPDWNTYYGFGDYRVAADAGFAGEIIEYMPIDNPALDAFEATSDDIMWTDRAGNRLTGLSYFGRALLEANVTRNGVPFDFDSIADLTYATDIFVERTYSFQVAGPAYDANGSIPFGQEFAVVRRAADIYDAAQLDNFKLPVLVQGALRLDNGQHKGADIKWVQTGFTSEAPYRIYEHLVVDGVVLDGSLFDEFVDAAGNNWKYYLPNIYRFVCDDDGNPATVPVTSVWTEALANVDRPYVWNPSVGRYEFLIDVTETVMTFDGQVVDVNVFECRPSGVFGTLDFTENWSVENFNRYGDPELKLITATLKGGPINGEIIEIPFIVDETENTWDVRWGAPNFNYNDVNTVVGLDNQSTDFLSDIIVNVDDPLNF